MRRGTTGWLVSLPVALAGCLAAHALAYRIVAPDAHERAHLLASSGHGYLGQLRLLFAVGLALVLVGFVRQTAAAARGRELSGPSRLVAFVPPVAFVLQEHLERGLHEGAFPVDALTQPSFLVGLALQLPFALLAFAVVALLSRAAAGLGRLLAERPAATLVSVAPAWRDLVPPSAPGIPGRGRAPPLLARP